MSNEDHNHLKNNQNVSWGSQYSAGKNIRIGNSTINFNINFSRALLALAVLLICLLYFNYQKPGSEKSVPPILSVDTSAQEETPLEEKPITKEKVKQEKPKPITVSLSFTNTDKALQKTAAFYIGQQLNKKNIYLTSEQNNAKPQRELHCEIQLQREEIELGFRSVIRVEFQYTIDLYDTASNLPINNHRTSSPTFDLYQEQEIPMAFKDWLEESTPPLIPNDFLVNNL